jgi:hypothetical protein
MDNNNNYNNYNNNNYNNTTNTAYDKKFILSKTYCYYCHCCDYCRETVNMKHTFNYNDINDNNIWNKMIELTMNRTNNNFENNEINIDTYIYYTQSENSMCEFNLPTYNQKIYLISEFKKKYL